jgi:hypothetical protein
MIEASINFGTEEGDGVSVATAFWLQKRQRSGQPALGRKIGMMIGDKVIFPAWV